ncbi:MAG: helix-turn-helix transcriptional regulator [Planctomycetes bacterium]|nr:helix-turn-helix transcriptional regulator [Planctomycetota bacterium]
MEKSLYTAKQKAFLALLKQVRVDAGLRQEDVAKRLKKPQSLISKVESGERRLDVLELRELCIVLGTSLVDFSRRLERVLSKSR